MGLANPDHRGKIREPMMHRRSPDPAPHIRASDADRERTGAFLERHCAEGRLTPEELSERLEAAYSARTLGELARLRSDLPEDPSALPARPQPARGRRALAVGVALAGLLLAAGTVTAVLPGVAIGFGVALVVLAFMLLFAVVSAAPLVAIVAGTVWVVRRLWPRAGRPLEPLR